MKRVDAMKAIMHCDRMDWLSSEPGREMDDISASTPLFLLCPLEKLVDNHEHGRLKQCGSQTNKTF